MKGLDVESKSVRVMNYQKKTVHSAMDIIGAMGLESSSAVKPEHIMKRVSSERVASYAELHPRPISGSLLTGNAGERDLQEYWDMGVKLNNLYKLRVASSSGASINAEAAGGKGQMNTAK